MSGSWRSWVDRGNSPAGAVPGRAGAGRRVGALAAAVLVTLPVAACGILSPPEREEARVRVTAESEALVHVATSTDFRAVDTTDTGADSLFIELLRADTIRDQSLPFDDRFSLGGSGRFYVEVLPADTATTNVVLEVFIDGMRRSEQAANIQEDRLSFVFVVSEG